MDKNTIVKLNDRCIVNKGGDYIDVLLYNKRYVLKGDNIGCLNPIFDLLYYPHTIDSLYSALPKDQSNRTGLDGFMDMILKLVSLNVLVLIDKSYFLYGNSSILKRANPDYDKPVNIVIIDTICCGHIFSAIHYLIANPNVVLHLHIHCVDDYEGYIKSRLQNINGNINLYFHKHCDYSYVEDLFGDVDIIALIQNEYYGALAKNVHRISLRHHIPFLNVAINDQTLWLGPLHIGKQTPCIECAVRSGIHELNNSARGFSVISNPANALLSYAMVVNELSSFIWPCANRRLKTLGFILRYDFNLGILDRFNLSRFRNCVCGVSTNEDAKLI